MFSAKMQPFRVPRLFSQGGWKLAQGKYDADVYCTGTPSSSPCVAFGDR